MSSINSGLEIINRLDELGLERLDDRTIVPGHPPDSAAGHPINLAEGADMVTLGSPMHGIYSVGAFAQKFVVSVGPALQLGPAFREVADAGILPDQPAPEVTPVTVPGFNPWETS